MQLMMKDNKVADTLQFRIQTVNLPGNMIKNWSANFIKWKKNVINIYIFCSSYTFTHEDLSFHQNLESGIMLQVSSTLHTNVLSLFNEYPIVKKQPKNYKKVSTNIPRTSIRKSHMGKWDKEAICEDVLEVRVTSQVSVLRELLFK
ncbi:Protein of unknown function, partial [Gryllus bimaculatus]